MYRSILPLSYAVGSNANWSRVYAAATTTETANLCKDGCSTAPLLSSFVSAPAGPGDRSWRTKLIWPPATKGKPLSGKIWTVAPPPVWRGEAHCFVSRQRVEAIWSSIRGEEGGKPRRGSTFKGTGARYQGLWSACMAQVTNPNAGVIYQAFNACR